MLRLLPLALILGACTKPADDDVVDLRRAFPEAPDDALVWEGPDYVIPAYTEKQWCWVDTYEGPTVGLHAQYSYQSQYGHHFVLAKTTALPSQLADGEVFDCTMPEDLAMTDLEPLMVGGTLAEGELEVSGELVLPDGMASKLESGTRLILQSHYVNVTPDDILVNDAIHFEVLEPDAVETWAAPYIHVQIDHPIPPQSEHTLEFECTWEEDVSLLFVGGHMHEWGTRFETRMTTLDGEETTIYAVEEWDPLMRDAPPYNEYGPGEFTVHRGDRFTTSCTWYNDTDDVLDFPTEMCVTFGMAYPSEVPIMCNPE